MIVNKTSIQTALYKDSKNFKNIQVFKASNLVTNKLNQDELKQVEKSLNTLTDITQGWAKGEKSEYDNIVYLSNNQKGINIKIGLSDENLNTLSAIFKDDVYKTANAEYILTGDAEAFVGGWFNEIAYARGYLSADIDKSGAIDANEIANLKTDFSTKTKIFSKEKDGVISADKSMTWIANRYETATHLSYEDHEKNIISIEKTLNETLIMDKNKDGTLSLDEIYQQNQWIDDMSQKVGEILENRAKDSEILVKAKIKIAQNEIEFKNIMLNVSKDTQDFIYKMLFKDDGSDKISNLLSQLSKNFDESIGVDKSV
ncbi:hypothetical protein LMG7974_01134 [Campylobacter majalis]|uniref:EF-hand domain-containing protein n=1 Tax=Campylobacter majalis TaxID=2790656 RepID=A0ABM8Q701_9BACT|nr:hypothetical protein [Campylobacter majalis]CAD7288750.1 hypothetical protein LMG7974_01134 [Campylobacter majalis]